MIYVEVNSAVDQWRNKGKQKEKEKNKKFRDEEFHKHLMAKDPDVVEDMLKRLARLHEAKFLPHDLAHKYEQVKSGFAKNKDEMYEKKAQKAEQPERKIEFVVDEDIKSSVWYDPLENPKGLPPRGKRQMYKHSDGTMSEDPPSKKMRLEKNTMTFGGAPIVPGFKGPMGPQMLKGVKVKEVKAPTDA